MSCGPACVRQLLLERGIDKTEKEIRKITDFTPDDGTREPSLAAALRTLDNAGAYHAGCVDPADFEQLVMRAPFLVLLKPASGEHWVIVDGMDGQLVLIRDPAGMSGDEDDTRGLEGTMKREVFDELWRLAIHRVVFRG